MEAAKRTFQFNSYSHFEALTLFLLIVTIISLGRNCEVAFAIRRHGFKLESSLLNWAFIDSDTALFKSILNPSGIFSKNYNLINPSMFRCDVLDVYLHAKKRFENWQELRNNDSILLSTISELKSRSNYLALKLESQLRGPGRVDAFLKPPRNTQGELQVFCRQLRQLIDETYPDNDVRLWIIAEGNEEPINQAYGLHEVYIRYVSEYTNDATSDQFSDRAKKEWHKLIAVSQPRIDRYYAYGRLIRTKYRPVLGISRFASWWR